MVESFVVNKTPEIAKEFEEFATEAELLFNTLRQNIESGKYSIVLGVDSSGRLPALLASEIIKKVSPNKDCKTVFISSERGNEHSDRYYSDLRERIKKLPSGSSVLLIDDSIHRGDSILSIINELKKHNILVDVGVLSIHDEKEFNSETTEWSYDISKNLNHLKNKLGSDIYYGNYGGISSVYGVGRWSGIRKMNENEMGKKSKEGKLVNMTTSKREPEADRVAKARQMVKLISNKILKDWGDKK